MKNKTKDILIEIVAILFVASAGIFVRNSTLKPINTGIWRMAFAIPFLFLFSYKNLKNLTKKDILISLLSGVFLAGDLIFFNMSLVRTSIANTNLFTNLTSFIIVPVSFFVFKEKIPKFYLVGLFIALIGVVILVRGKTIPTQSNYVGDLFAVGSCFFYSLFFLTVYKLRERLSSSVIMFIGAFGTLICLIIAAGIIEGLELPKTGAEILNLLGFSLCLQVIGQNLLAHCQGKISVNLSSAITLMQPAVAGIYSFLLFREKLSTKEILGMLVVMIGIYICKRQYEK